MHFTETLGFDQAAAALSAVAADSHADVHVDLTGSRSSDS